MLDFCYFVQALAFAHVLVWPDRWGAVCAVCLRCLCCVFAVSAGVCVCLCCECLQSVRVYV